MANGRFTASGAISPYTFDHSAAALQRVHERRVAEESRQERAESWIAAKLVGQSFGSFETLAATACATVSTHYNRALTSDEHRVVVNAARALWSGFAFRTTLARVHVTVDRSASTITFRRAA